MTGEDAIATTLKDVEKLLFLTISRMRKQYQLDFDEMLSAAYLGFTEAFHSYSNDKGEFTTWVAFKATKAIQTLLRKEIKRTSQPVTSEIELTLIAYKESFWDIDEWMETLSEEARMVAQLALAPPSDIKATLAQLKYKTPANWRYAIRDYLNDCGWVEDKVKRVFQEIHEAL